MKLATFETAAGLAKLGAYDREGRMLDLAIAQEASGVGKPSYFTSMQALIEAGEFGLQAADAIISQSPDEAVAVAGWRLLAPLPVPVQIRDCLSFETHLHNSFESVMKLTAARASDPIAAEAELRASGRFAVPDVWYKQPIYYKANRFAVGAPESDVVWPSYSELMDFELELACVIGRKGRDIASAAAEEHIFGYTVLNDFSARDAQAIEQMGMLGPAKGKDFDGANVMGPVIVTADEIGDAYALAMRARVNGESWTDGNSSTMHWRFPDIIAHISQSETLYPGEVIGSGTVGWGCGLEHMRFLNDGDVVELEIQGIGCLRNRVVRSVSLLGVA